MTDRPLRAILTYHALDTSRAPISMDEATFRRHAAWLASGRVRVCPLADLPGQPADIDAVALTFDDGFASFAQRAWPVLRDHGLSATVFVVSDHVGGTNAWGGRPDSKTPILPLMDWQTLARLAEAGVELGAHTRSHRDLRGASAGELEDELAGCAERIAVETGYQPSSLAYPYGVLNAAVAAAAARVYARACTALFRPLGPREDVYRLPRLDAFYFRGPGRLEAWGTQGFHRYLRVRAAARTVRAALARGY